MAYTIQAIICDEKLLEVDVPPGAKVVRLPQRKSMIPFNESFCDLHNITLLPLIDAGKPQLPNEIVELCESISKGGKAVYIEAEFFAGEGTQASAMWERGEIVKEALVENRAINLALEFLGVEKGFFIDCFDALELSRHRDTEGWVA